MTDPRLQVSLDDILVNEALLGRGGMSEVTLRRLARPVELAKRLVLSGELSPVWIGVDENAIPYKSRDENALPEPITNPEHVNIINTAAEEYKSALVNSKNGKEDLRNLWDALGFKSHVAMKEFRIAPDVNPRDRDKYSERFRKEVVTLRKLHHPNIINTHWLVQEPGRLCLLLDHVDGMTLDDYVKLKFNGNPVPYEFVAKTGRQLAHALAHAHEKGVIHRDIKPGNIMVTKDEKPVIMDFGIAKIVDKINDLNLGRTMIAGTPRYSAPEQFTGEGVGYWTDVYQFGMLMFRLLAGRSAYDSNPNRQMLLNLDIPHPSFVRQYRRDISDKFSDLVEISRSKHKELRFTAPELVDEFDELIAKKQYTSDVESAVRSSRANRAAKREGWRDSNGYVNSVKRKIETVGSKVSKTIQEYMDATMKGEHVQIDFSLRNDLLARIAYVEAAVNALPEPEGVLGAGTKERILKRLTNQRNYIMQKH